MSIYSKTLIDIPDDTDVHAKSAGSKCEKYVYKYVKYLRNNNGKPRNKSKSIGKLDATTGMAIAMQNYPLQVKILIQRIKPCPQHGNRHAKLSTSSQIPHSEDKTLPSARQSLCKTIHLKPNSSFRG